MYCCSVTVWSGVDSITCGGGGGGGGAGAFFLDFLGFLTGFLAGSDEESSESSESLNFTVLTFRLVVIVLAFCAMTMSLWSPKNDSFSGSSNWIPGLLAVF